MDNSYIFKIETIIITSPFPSSREIYEHIFKLSKNPLSSVKRIIIDNFLGDIDEIRSKFTHNDYNTKRLPRIYIDNFKHQRIFKDKYDAEKKIYYLYEKEKTIKLSKYPFYFRLTFKDNLIRERKFSDLLYVIFNCPEKLSRIYIYDDFYSDDSAYPGIRYSNKENLDINVNKMKKMFHEYKESNICYCHQKIRELTFSHSSEPELIIFYYTILDILIQMKIKIEEICFLRPFTVANLVEFLEKYKTFESLNINNISLYVKKSRYDKYN